MLEYLEVSTVTKQFLCTNQSHEKYFDKSTFFSRLWNYQDF